jgi:hypothetical protein
MDVFAHHLKHTYMKKIFTFLFFACLVMAASAQGRHAQYRDQNMYNRQPAYQNNGHEPGNSYHHNDQDYGRSNGQGFIYNNDGNDERNYDRGNNRRFDDRNFNDVHRGFDNRMQYDRFGRYSNRARFRIGFRHRGW